MKLFIACVFLVSFVPLPGFARSGTPPPSRQRQTRPLMEIQRHAVPATDVAAELTKDAQHGELAPTRYAVGHAVTITPETHGTWEQLPDGRLWRLQVESPGATDLNLGFNSFWLPEGATLHISAVSNAYFQGPYTAEDNKPHGQLWTPVVPGEAATIELFVPATATVPPRLVLRQIGAGYRDMFHRKDGGLAKAGSCNIDVVCPLTGGWSNEVRSVAMYSINGVQACTGTLLANAQGDFRSFFLTANHCGLNSVNDATVVVYWNYQSPVCGQQGGGSLAQNQNGSTFRAARSDVDFALIELDELPDPAFNVYYAGWDRSGVAPAGCVGIHHPSSDEKSISFSTNALLTTNSCIGTGGTNSHWRVVWSTGVTEPGSSGSAIWDSTTHRIVGTLTGGGSSCASPAAFDCYGKFSVAWNGSGSTSRLRDWLDPQNTGVLSIPGADPGLGSGSPAQPLIVNPRFVEPGQMIFSYEAAAGQTYFIQTTTNLGAMNWSVLQTNVGAGALQSFTNSATNPGGRFFRLRSL